VWDGDRWRRSLDKLSQAIRNRWPEFQYACLIEFTTGHAERSGGHRRPHGNLFVRGVSVDDREELQALVASVWVPRMIEHWDRSERYAASAFRQQRVDVVHEMRGLTRYVALHFLKESQAPPKGWRGQRFRASQGYFAESRAVVREQARESLRAGRRLWKAEQHAWWRAIDDAREAGYEDETRGQAAYLGHLVVEGFIEEWTLEHLALLEEQAAVPRVWEIFRGHEPLVPARARKHAAGELHK
jgi:hypothetical protein